MKKFFLEHIDFFHQYESTIVNDIKYLLYSRQEIGDNTITNIEKLLLKLWNLIPSEQVEIKVGLRKQLNYLYMEKMMERISLVEKVNKKQFKGVAKRDVHQDKIYNYYYTKIAENNLNISRYLYSESLIGEAWEWCMKSLDITYKKENEWLLFSDFIWDQAISFHGDHKRKVALDIISNYFNLSSIMGHNFDECHRKYNETKRWLKSDNNAQGNDVAFLLTYLALLDKSFNRSNANEVVNRLDRIFRSLKKRDIELANLLSYYMANSQVIKILNKDTLTWVKKYEETKQMDLNWQVSVNMTLLKMVENGNSNSKLIIDTIKFALNSILTITQSPIYFSLQKQKYSFLIIKAVRHLLNIKDYNTAIKIILLWKTFNPNNTNPCLDSTDLDPLLIIIPTNSANTTNYICYVNGQIHFLEYEQINDIIKLTDIKNNFEQKWTVISGFETTRVVIGDNPKEEFSEEYKKVVTSFYRLDELTQIINSDKNVSIIEFVHLNNPIAPLLNTICNNSFSYLTSREKKPIPKIKKVLIWCDPWDKNPILYGHREKNIILEILKQTDIEVDCFVGGSDDVTYESFNKKYTSDEYDLVWIICHGSFNYDNPTNSLLYLTNDRPLPIIDIINKNPHRDHRRLLFLNACQSSVSQVRFDGINFTGMGTSLTNENQSVIGHLWEVNSFVASYFGPVLFYHLINSTNWGRALKESQELFLKGNKEVYDFLKNVVEIKDNDYLEALLSKNAEDFSKLIYFGSAVLYE